MFGSQKTTNNQNSSNPIGEISAEMYQGVTTEQRLAILGFETSIMSFAQGSAEKREALKMIEYEMKALNISESQFISYAQRGGHNRVQDIVNGLKPITSRTALDSTLYMGFGIARVCKNKEAFGYLTYVFEQLGYTEDEMLNVIKKIELFGKQFE